MSVTNPSAWQSPMRSVHARILACFLALTAFVPAALAECESQLSGRPPIAEVTSVLVAEIQRQNIPSQQIARSVLETLTAVEPKIFSWNDYAYNLVHRLHSIQRWRPLIDRVTWYGHNYTELQFLLSHLIVNSFWGQPLNLHALDWLYVALFQFAERKESRLSLAIGPFSNSDETQARVTPLLKRLFPDLVIESHQVVVDDRSLGYLILRGIPQEPTGLEFAERLVSRLQDRR